jgi:3',5'-nucleoside bisphosphate phosphatase
MRKIFSLSSDRNRTTMNKKIDFHTHTTASDGIYTPSQLIDIALEENIIAMAITDHDTIDGLAEGIEYSAGKDLELIQGIEFSIEYARGTFHLVGLNIDHTDSELSAECKRLTAIREGRAERIVHDLNSRGINISFREVEALSPEGAIGRPHIGRILIKNGYARDMNEVFANFMVKGKPGYVSKEKIKLESAVSLIENSGGIPVIAHPVSLNFNGPGEFEKILREFIEKGVRGIEAYSTMHTPKEREMFLHFAHKYNLLVSGGSDFHGDKREEIGHCSDDMLIPLELYNKMKSLIKNNPR